MPSWLRHGAHIQAQKNQNQRCLPIQRRAAKEPSVVNVVLSKLAPQAHGGGSTKHSLLESFSVHGLLHRADCSAALERRGGRRHWPMRSTTFMCGKVRTPFFVFKASASVATSAASLRLPTGAWFRPSSKSGSPIARSTWTLEERSRCWPSPSWWCDARECQMISTIAKPLKLNCFAFQNQTSSHACRVVCLSLCELARACGNDLTLRHSVPHHRVRLELARH